MKNRSYLFLLCILQYRRVGARLPWWNFALPPWENLFHKNKWSLGLAPSRFLLPPPDHKSWLRLCCNSERQRNQGCQATLASNFGLCRIVRNDQKLAHSLSIANQERVRYQSTCGLYSRMRVTYDTVHDIHFDDFTLRHTRV
jgi:hypothetical protein